MTKAERIKQELDKLNRLYSGLPENKKKLCEGLLQNAAYIKATLFELQETVNEDGAVIKDVNGNGFKVYQQHPANVAYTALIARYATVIDKLSNMLPVEERQGKLGALDDE